MTDADARKAAAALNAIGRADSPDRLREIERAAVEGQYRAPIAKALEVQRARIERRRGT